jgi:hypothetical protein
MDRLLGRIFNRFADATLILSTAMSQEAWTAHKSENGGAFYRPRDLMNFARCAGVEATFTAAPVMSEQFHLEFGDVAAAQDGEAKLAALRMKSAPLMYVQRTGSRVFAGCAVSGDVRADAVVTAAGREWKFSELFYKVPTAKTGMHHPDGVLWIRMQDRQHANGGRVPLTSVAPTVLSLFGVAAPVHMESGALPLDRSAQFPMRAIA